VIPSRQPRFTSRRLGCSANPLRTPALPSSSINNAAALPSDTSLGGSATAPQCNPTQPSPRARNLYQSLSLPMSSSPARLARKRAGKGLGKQSSAETSAPSLGVTPFHNVAKMLLGLHTCRVRDVGPITTPTSPTTYVPKSQSGGSPHDSNLHGSNPRCSNPRCSNLRCSSGSLRHLLILSPAAMPQANTTSGGSHQPRRFKIDYQCPPLAYNLG